MFRLRGLCLIASPLLCSIGCIAQPSVQAPSQQAQESVFVLSGNLQAELLGGPMQDKAAEARVLDALLAAWHETADGKDYAAMQAVVDAELKTSPASVPPRALLECLLVTGQEKYRDALDHASVTDDPVYQAMHAAAWKRPAPPPPSGHPGATDEGAQLLATLADSYAAQATQEWTNTSTSADKTLWELAARSAAKPWMKSAADPSHEDANLIAAYGIAKLVRLGLLPVEDDRRAVALSTTKYAVSRPTSLLAATEIAQVSSASLGYGKIVLGDAWFNSQLRKGLNGDQELFHYKWNDQQNSGFSFFGSAFTRYGAQLAQLDAAPTPANLHGASVYVIASPDIPAKNPTPHFMDKSSADAIEAWVRAGGVLLLMENDKNNSEFTQFNTLSERFGIHFNPVLRNTVEGRQFEQGMLKIPAGAGGIFPNALTVYMKEICTISVSGPAQPIYHDRGDVLMAVAHAGKGTVYAVVDPWLYNEYTDGRKLPAEYEDFTAAKNIAKWALEQAH